MDAQAIRDEIAWVEAQISATQRQLDDLELHREQLVYALARLHRLDQFPRPCEGCAL